MTSVKGLEGPEVVLSTGPLKMTATLAAGCLSNLQLAIECMHLCHDIEDVCVGLVVAGEFRNQPPIVRAVGQVNGLMVGSRFPRYSVNEPYGEWLGG